MITCLPVAPDGQVAPGRGRVQVVVVAVAPAVGGASSVSLAVAGR